MYALIFFILYVSTTVRLTVSYFDISNEFWPAWGAFQQPFSPLSYTVCYIHFSEFLSPLDSLLIPQNYNLLTLIRGRLHQQMFAAQLHSWLLWDASSALQTFPEIWAIIVPNSEEILPFPHSRETQRHFPIEDFRLDNSPCLTSLKRGRDSLLLIQQQGKVIPIDPPFATPLSKPHGKRVASFSATYHSFAKLCSKPLWHRVASSSHHSFSLQYFR